MGVEVCADKFIVIVDESKLCDALGPGFAVPVEITPFCHLHTLKLVENLPSVAGKAKAVLRMGSSSSNVCDGDDIAVTDNGNYIVDLQFSDPITDAPTMASEIKNTVGVVDHGLFCGLTTAVIIAGKDGSRLWRRKLRWPVGLSGKPRVCAAHNAQRNTEDTHTPMFPCHMWAFVWRPGQLQRVPVDSRNRPHMLSWLVVSVSVTRHAGVYRIRQQE